VLQLHGHDVANSSDRAMRVSECTNKCNHDFNCKSMAKKDTEAFIRSSNTKTSPLIAFGGPCLSRLDEFEL
jgi:hypothetical protein